MDKYDEYRKKRAFESEKVADLIGEIKRNHDFDIFEYHIRSIDGWQKMSANEVVTAFANRLLTQVKEIK